MLIVPNWNDKKWAENDLKLWTDFWTRQLITQTTKHSIRNMLMCIWEAANQKYQHWTPLSNYNGVQNVQQLFLFFLASVQVPF